MYGDPLTPVWYYSKTGATAGQQIGPMSWEQLHLLAQTGALTFTDMVWNPQLPQWVTAAEIPGLLPPAPFAAQQSAYPAGGQAGGQWQAPPAAYYPPYQGQYGAPKKGGSSWLVWVIPLIALVLAGTGLGLYLGLRGDDGGTVGSTGTTKRTTTTAGGTTTTDGSGHHGHLGADRRDFAGRPRLLDRSEPGWRPAGRAHQPGHGLRPGGATNAPLWRMEYR